MTNLFSHNLISGWRNIMKYKVQNAVSVLCLSVGIICFGITLYFVNATLHYKMKWEFDDKYYHCDLATDDGGDHIMASTITFADSVQQLPSVKSVLFNTRSISATFTFRAETGQECTAYTQLSFISPDWLKENNFYSTITGKPIETLEAGTVVLSERIRQRMRFDNPIGSYATNTKYGAISDVVISDTYMQWFDGLYVVAEGNKNMPADADIADAQYIYSLNVRLNDDATFDQFQSEMKTLRPNVTVLAQSRHKFFALSLLAMFIFLGASVLIIGLSGYMKMQLQLFMLRSREIALRRCNGAQSRQLFALYVTEILIIAMITALLTAAITYGFQDFIMPKLIKLGVDSYIYFNFTRIYGFIAAALIAAFVAAIVLSWFQLRRMLHKPLSQTAGRSYAQKSAFSKTMQVAQYFVATILFFIIILVFGVLMHGYLSNGLDINSATALHKHVVPRRLGNINYEDFEQEMLQLPSVEKQVRFFRISSYINEEDDNFYGVMQNEFVDRHWYLGLYANPEIFGIYGKEVSASFDSTTMSISYFQTIPVLAYPEEARQMATELGISHIISGEPEIMPDSMEYIRIGYAQPLPQELLLNNRLAYYVVASDSMFSKMAAINENFARHYSGSEHIIKPVNDDVESFRKDVAIIWAKHFPSHDYSKYNVCETAYDRWGSILLSIEIIGQLCTLLFLISILCIVLTVYSSASLETRGRQKEIAIRKVNGAKTWDIVKLMSRHYVRTLLRAFILAYIVGLTIILTYAHDYNDIGQIISVCTLIWFVSIAVITSVTAITVGFKIYKVARTNAAEYLGNN